MFTLYLYFLCIMSWGGRVSHLLCSPQSRCQHYLYLCERCPLPAPKRKSLTKVSPNLQYISTRTLSKYVSKKMLIHMILKNASTACTTICRRYREKKSKKIYQPIQNETFSFCHIEEKINLCSKLCDLHWRRVTILLRSASASLYFAILPISLLCSDLLNRCNHWG